jgi:hypothetical protein
MRCVAMIVLMPIGMATTGALIVVVHRSSPVPWPTGRPMICRRGARLIGTQMLTWCYPVSA